MQAGDIVFVRTQGFISDAIRFFDKGEFNHVAIFVSDTEIVEAEYNTKVHKISFTYEDYVVVPMNLTADEQKVLQDTINHFIGEDYDFVQIVRILVEKTFGDKHWFKFNNPKEVICSELAADVLEALHKIPEGNENLAPNELYNLLIQKYPLK